MGNSQRNKQSQYTSASQIQKAKLSVLYELQIGEVLELNLSTSTQHTSPSIRMSQSQPQSIIFYRQISFPCEQTMKRAYTKLLSFQSRQQMDNNSFICKLLSLQKNIKNSMCTNIHSIQLFLEVSETTLSDEIEARVKVGMQYFDFSDVAKIIYALIKSLQTIELEIRKFKIENIDNIMNMVFIHPGRIMLMPSGMIKIISPLMISPYDRFQYRNMCYYSPQKLGDFDFEDDTKSAIFQLGITLIHILTLKDCQQIYNGFEVQEDVIDKYIGQIWSIYQNQLLCELLSKMTRVIRSRRASIQDCIYFAGLLEVQKITMTYDEQNYGTNMTDQGFSFLPRHLSSSRKKLSLYQNKSKLKAVTQIDQSNNRYQNVSSCFITQEPKKSVNEPFLHLKLFESGYQSVPNSYKDSFQHNLGLCSYKYGQSLNIGPPMVKSMSVGSQIDENKNLKNSNIVDKQNHNIGNHEPHKFIMKNRLKFNKQGNNSKKILQNYDNNCLTNKMPQYFLQKSQMPLQNYCSKINQQKQNQFVMQGQFQKSINANIMEEQYRQNYHQIPQIKCSLDSIIQYQYTNTQSGQLR